MPDVPPLALAINPEALARLMKLALVEVLTSESIEGLRASDQEVFNEAEAAEFLRLNPNQLADERRRGRIGHSRIVGRQIRYRREDLLAYLTRDRHEAESN
jgi:hypothetical protein